MKPRTLIQLINDLSDLVAAEPKAVDWLVVTSRDDEGNGYNVVFFQPQCAEADGLEMDNYTFEENESVVILN